MCCLTPRLPLPHASSRLPSLAANFRFRESVMPRAAAKAAGARALFLATASLCCCGPSAVPGFEVLARLLKQGFVAATDSPVIHRVALGVPAANLLQHFLFLQKFRRFLTPERQLLRKRRQRTPPQRPSSATSRP